MRTMTSRFAVGVAALAAVALPGGTPAGAATATDEACLMQATTGRVQCYPSADALLEAVTGEPAEGFSTADLAAPATVAAIEAGLADSRSEGLRAPGAPLAAAVVTAIFYDGTYATGAALVMEAPAGCDDDPGVEWAWPTLTPEWRNRIRSGVGYARCDFKVWNHAWYAGAAYGFVSSAGYLGALDRAASSVRMR
ncbi:hypothetical protein ACFFOS_13815 [Nocardioides kongjuensis]|uniref:Peptidase inhibitor family I36 protein n=1 Tax=Nocardioides kongjuensis TaxID=349522 RepID=A0A852RC62_9ACTN|nr:hypothetical protein [Nocardioides kongjuensis]NYD32563.1 hypothetical protein [Nocardioides kongjuensis]